MNKALLGILTAALISAGKSTSKRRFWLFWYKKEQRI